MSGLCHDMSLCPKSSAKMTRMFGAVIDALHKEIYRVKNSRYIFFQTWNICFFLRLSNENLKFFPEYDHSMYFEMMIELASFAFSWKRFVILELRKIIVWWWLL